jgi:glucosamine--fructose-6-phosphate aminotransferase (isomerizing)
MCGIVGCVTDKKSKFAAEAVFKGLEQLEYRGYDSAGISVVTNPVVTASDPNSDSETGMQKLDDKSSFDTRRAVGKLTNLKSEIENKPFNESAVAIGHTRWATHGTPTIENTHPHISSDGKISLVHNGIIENANSLKPELEEKGVVFKSDSDTAVACELLASIVARYNNMLDALSDFVTLIKGSYAFSVIWADEPDTIYALRHNSPLVIGLGENVKFVASDTIAFSSYTTAAIEILQDQIVEVKSNSVQIYDFNLSEIDYHDQMLAISKHEDSKKEGFETYMEKEIRETPKAVIDTIYGATGENNELSLDKLNFDEEFFKRLDKIVVVACGTACHSAYVARYAIEHWCRVPVEVEFAHEFRYRDPILTQTTLVIAISQSGETMDTLMALRYALEQGAKTLAICNTKGSSLAREADAVLYTNAGREIAVASTKAFVCQVVACYIFGLYLARLRQNLYDDEIQNKLNELLDIPAKIETVLESFNDIAEFTATLSDTEAVLFLGRHTGYPIALEGALKLKEIAYIHSEGFAAGELKHGPIAIIDEGQIVMVIVPPVSSKASLHAKVISNIEEILARGAKVIAVAEDGDPIIESLSIKVFYRPKTPTLFAPILDIVPLQIFALKLAEVLGRDVDKPRNLAKSVTVE